MMVTGFNLVLYSRLHLSLRRPKLLRVILLVILRSALIFQAPAIIMVCISGVIDSTVYSEFNNIYRHFDIIATVQEMLLSALYIHLFKRFMRQGESRLSKHALETFYFWILVEVCIVLCQVLLNVLLFLRLYLLRKMVWEFLYTCKLRVEFIVLNRLKESGPQKQVESHAYGAELVFGNVEAGTSILSRPPARSDVTGFSASEGLCNDSEGGQTKYDVSELERIYLGRIQCNGEV
jgi:hypothetical protein